MARYKRGSSGQGRKCPHCGSLDTMLKEWIKERKTGRTKGVRKCSGCGRKYDTYPSR
jgi:hypothetical protein